MRGWQTSAASPLAPPARGRCCCSWGSTSSPAAQAARCRLAAAAATAGSGSGGSSGSGAEARVTEERASLRLRALPCEGRWHAGGDQRSGAHPQGCRPAAPAPGTPPPACMPARVLGVVAERPHQAGAGGEARRRVRAARTQQQRCTHARALAAVPCLRCRQCTPRMRRRRTPARAQMCPRTAGSCAATTVPAAAARSRRHPTS